MSWPSAKWRWLLGALLITLLLSQADLEAFRQVLSRLQPMWLVGAALIYFLSHLALGASLHSACLGLGLPTRLATVLATHFEAGFFASFLPSSLGGDVFKIADLSRRFGHLAAVTIAVGIQRLLALALALLLLFASMPSAVGSKVASLRLSTVAVAAISGIGLLAALGAVLWRSPAARRRWKPVQEGLRRALVGCRRLVASGSLWPVVAFQIAALLLSVSGSYAASRSLGLGVDWHHFCYLVPATYVGVAIPITVSGLGVREAIYAGLLGLQGVSVTDAVALALVILGMTWFFALLGGLIHMTRPTAVAAEPADG